MPVSKTSSSGRIPRSRIRSASATIVSGALTDAEVRKFRDPSVRLAMSGLAAPSSSRTSARRSSSATSRPLVDTHSTASGQRSRIAGRNWA